MLQNTSMISSTSIYVDFETLTFEPALNGEKDLLSNILTSVHAHYGKDKKYHVAGLIGFATMDKEGEEIWETLIQQGAVVGRYHTREMICVECKAEREKSVAEGGGKVKVGELLQIVMTDKIFRKARFLKSAGLVDKSSIGIISGDPFFHEEVVVSTLQQCGIDAYSILAEGVSKKPITAAKREQWRRGHSDGYGYGSFNRGRKKQWRRSGNLMVIAV